MIARHLQGCRRTLWAALATVLPFCAAHAQQATVPVATSFPSAPPNAPLRAAETPPAQSPVVAPAPQPPEAVAAPNLDEVLSKQGDVTLPPPQRRKEIAVRHEAAPRRAVSNFKNP